MILQAPGAPALAAGKRLRRRNRSKPVTARVQRGLVSRVVSAICELEPEGDLSRVPEIMSASADCN